MDPLRPLRGEAGELLPALEAWLAAPAEPRPLVVETSGSTGRPKRVLLSRRAVLVSAAATRTRLGWSGPWVLALPAHRVAGLQVLVRSLVAGHPPVLGHASLAAAVAAAPDSPAISLVPTQLHRALGSPEETDALRRCHVVLLGGGPIPRGLRGRAEASGVRVVATYGATETAGGCVYDGRPLDDVRVAVDDDTGRIRIAGPTLFDGYDGDPAQTAASLVDGWFLTSDAGRVGSDGRLTVLGRLDDMVVSGGVNVPLPAVTARLRDHPEVTDAAVVGVPDPEWGQRVVAFVVGRLSLAEARDWVTAAHPRAWAPREVRTVDALPLLESGKVDRMRLRARA